MVFINGSEITQKISRSVQFLAFSLTQHVKTEASKTVSSVSSGECIHQNFSAYNSFSITRVPKCGHTRFRSDFHIANRRRQLPILRLCRKSMLYSIPYCFILLFISHIYIIYHKILYIVTGWNHYISGCCRFCYLFGCVWSFGESQQSHRQSTFVNMSDEKDLQWILQSSIWPINIIHSLVLLHHT